ncbi:hypothetical protein [uncultured Psychroserpens sp.]|uniref:glycoside hydrolase family 113 n=1 Tax=uncultured Psychroserpens sp. TaxID=255436 RepID=UPI00262536B7|nr:hypothetical protein [uncultured Psychroserpens sp.]
MATKQQFLKRLNQFLLWYVIGVIILIIFVVIVILINDIERGKQTSIFFQILGRFFKFIPTYFALVIPYLLFLLIRSIVRDFKKSRFLGLLKGVGLKIVLPVLIFWMGKAGIDHYRLTENFDYTWDYSIENKDSSVRNLYAKDKKQRGFHIFGSSNDSISFEILKTNNVEWLTYVPFISQEHYDKPTLRKRSVLDDSTGRYQHWKHRKERAQAYGFKIMLKPHIWLQNRENGAWRSDINMATEDEWDQWFEDYSQYILDYAVLAETLNIELFCIGTELHKTVLEQPERWERLISEIRNVYSGKLTYGANWNQEVDDIPFWDALDFIGIQAYYPIATNENPELLELENGWNQHIAYLEELHKKYQKPILFTELGYKSTADAGIKPWEWNNLSNSFHKKISKRTQALCYQAFFNTIWQKPWFEGAHLWEWQSSRNDSDGNNNAFVVQGKPALNVIAKGFKKVTD